MSEDFGVTHKEFSDARGLYPSLRVCSTRRVGSSHGLLVSLLCRLFGGDDGASTMITAVSFDISGITGGGKRRRKRYTLFVDVGSIRNSIPNVWVLKPTDSRVKHVNIWHPKNCSALGRKLPMFCWGDFEDEWSRAPRSARKLAPLIENVNQFLNRENHDSPAR